MAPHFNRGNEIFKDLITLLNICLTLTTFATAKRIVENKEK